MNKTDLHTHSTVSDGTLTPTELINKAAEIGLETIALTDHDTIEGVGEALEAAKAFPGLEVIAGTELSSLYKDKEIHIVGLFLDLTNNEFVSALDDLKEKRIKRNKKMTNKLRGLGLDLSYDELLSVSGGKVVTRAHFARLLKEKGYVESKNEAFLKYIGTGKPGYVKREVLTAEKAVALIKTGGGLPIVAHPFAYGFNIDELEQMAADFSCWGAVGMECYYSTHTEEETRLALSLCRTYDLLPSGGSDFHGDNKPGLELGIGYGSLEVPKQILDDLKVKKYGKKINQNNSTK